MKAHYAQQLAAFLQQLSAIPLAECRAAALPETDVPSNTARYRKLYDDVQKELFPLMMRPTQEWVKRLFRPFLEDNDFLNFTPVLIHDDLAYYHILHDPSQQTITGIIDFGDSPHRRPGEGYWLALERLRRVLCASHGDVVSGDFWWDRPRPFLCDLHGTRLGTWRRTLSGYVLVYRTFRPRQRHPAHRHTTQSVIKRHPNKHFPQVPFHVKIQLLISDSPLQLMDIEILEPSQVIEGLLDSEDYTHRVGRQFIYSCPRCGHRVRFKWLNLMEADERSFLKPDVRSHFDSLLPDRPLSEQGFLDFYCPEL